MYTVIVVDFNTIEKTIEYLQHCEKRLMQEEIFHAVIIDNGTRHDTVDLLNRALGEGKLLKTSLGKEVYSYEENKCRKVLLCLAKENLGYAKGNNLGVRLAREIFGDPYYLICNNDLIITKCIELKKVTEVFVKNPRVAVIGPYTEGVDGSVNNPHKFQSAFRKLILWYWNMIFFRAFEKIVCDIDYDGRSKECDWVTGCFVFVKADAFERAGMFDEQTFLYGEELILSKRLESIGCCCYFYNDMKIIHNHGETVKKSISTINNVKYTYDSMGYYYKEYVHTSKWLLAWAEINFKLYKIMFLVKEVVKKMMRRDRWKEKN